jgi:hypothetical protein
MAAANRWRRLAQAAAAGGGGGGAARAGEIQVFPIALEVGKCYQHIEATRSAFVGYGAERREVFFSTNQPRYVGEFKGLEETGHLGGDSTIATFNDGNIQDNFVEFTYPGEGQTCFIQVPCSHQPFNKTLTQVYEKKTGQSAEPGTGPANSIRKFLGIYKGGRRKNTRRARRQSKKTRSRSRN